MQQGYNHQLLPTIRLLEVKSVDTRYRLGVGMLCAVLLATLAGNAGAAVQQSPEDEVASVVSSFHMALAAGD